MLTLYVTLLVKGIKTFAQVPVTLKLAIESELVALDLGTDGKPVACKIRATQGEFFVPLDSSRGRFFSKGGCISRIVGEFVEGWG